MARVLCTFSGKFGDILWSLPTVRAVFQMVGGERVDFGIMPPYRSLLPLLQAQPYIANAFVIENWECEGSPHGDQPWQPPKEIEANYERSFHLTYKMHPGIHRPPTIALIDFIAEQQGIALRDPIPFIEVKHRHGENLKRIVTYAFNEEDAELKNHFLNLLKERFKDLIFVDAGKHPWLTAAEFIYHSGCFVGCRSANNVIAHGVGQKNIFIYETNSSRHVGGPFGMTFGCPYNAEKTALLGARPDAAVELAVQAIRSWQEQYQLQEATQ